MHHGIRTVAEGRFIDPDQFEAFALENRDRYSVSGPDEHMTISTFYVDDLVDAFKASLGDDFDSHRAEQVEIALVRRR